MVFKDGPSYAPNLFGFAEKQWFEMNKNPKTGEYVPFGNFPKIDREKLLKDPKFREDTLGLAMNLVPGGIAGITKKAVPGLLKQAKNWWNGVDNVAEAAGKFRTGADFLSEFAPNPAKVAEYVERLTDVSSAHGGTLIANLQSGIGRGQIHRTLLQEVLEWEAAYKELGMHHKFLFELLDQFRANPEKFTIIN